MKTAFHPAPRILLATWILCYLACVTAQSANPPSLLREFRGAWIATVSNIDWPSEPGLPSHAQKAELTALFDQAVHLKLNAIILQVRPASDALYRSKIEPWSEYLTGKQGVPPAPFYDPLKFAIAEAHKRGLELHAWFNPFRARHPSASSSSSKTHVSRRYPRLVKNYGSYLWLDPGEPIARDYSTAVILDVVKRYDIDGVHLDDYFYPYKQKDRAGKLIDFPDSASWEKYRSKNGRLKRNDWRRKNVDDFLRNLYVRIKKEKRWVKFGISPFGIWRPGHPPQISGLDAYDQIYADSRKWILNGWADYFAPQLYWTVQSPRQSYPILLDWWARQNKKNRHLWPGMNTHQVGIEWTPSEILEQIRRTRKQPGATGHTHWNFSALMRKSSGLQAALMKAPYSAPALVPASPWLDNKPPATPKVYIEKFSGTKNFKLHWETGDQEKVWLWLIQTKIGNRWRTDILPQQKPYQIFSSETGTSSPDEVLIKAVDRCGNIGRPAVIRAHSAKPTIE